MVVCKAGFSSRRHGGLSVWRGLSLASMFLLASCNNTNVPMSGLLASKANAKEAQRERTYKRVALQLREQKRAISNGEQGLSDATIPTARSSILRASQPAKSVEPVGVKTALLSPVSPIKPADLSPIVPSKPTFDPDRVRPVPNGQSVPAGFGPLGRFHAKLAALQSGKRRKPVTILHIGDSHVASDSFTRGIRRQLQARYGNAGRGMVIPAKAFKYGVADKVKLTASGNWRSQTALKKRKGRFGLSGVNVMSRSSNSVMSMTTRDGTFDWAEVTVATGPSQGLVKVKVGAVVKTFNAQQKSKGSKTFRVTAKGDTLKVYPGGGAQTTVLNWATGREKAGIRYINFGLIGATLNITNRFDMKLVAHDIARLDPDLIVYGYGTNEGFNDGLNLKRYAKRAASYVAKLKKSAPNADVVYLGAASGLRRKGNRACSGWSTPPKLSPLRTTVRKLAARQNAAYWDWSQAMGGPCAVNAWAKQGLAAKDRVHLTGNGYNKSAKVFVDWLTQPASSNVRVASN